MWQERLALLKYKGGFKAALFWLMKILFRIEVYFFYSIDLNQQQSLSSSSFGKGLKKIPYRFISLNTLRDIAIYPSETIKQINSQSGRGVSQLVHRNAGVYALIEEDQVMSQANIDRNTVIQVDSPAHLNIHLKSGDVFLGYLYTYQDYRGRGMAAALLKNIRENLSNYGYLRIVTHIRSTNVASLNTFRKCRWSKIGWIIISVKGHLLLTHGLSKSGITIFPTKPADQ